MALCHGAGLQRRAMVVFAVALVYAMLAVAGAVTLLLAGNHRRARRQSGAIPLVAAGIALVLLSVGILAAYDVAARTMRFNYTVTLTPNVSGTVRMLLPAPVDSALVANLASSSGTSVVRLNQSGTEPAIEITLSERTTLTASFVGYRHSGPHDLTRADSLDACSNPPLNGCNATVTLVVISGGVSEVHVMAKASWSYDCYYPEWELDATSLPGERGYQAQFHLSVC